MPLPAKPSHHILIKCKHLRCIIITPVTISWVNPVSKCDRLWTLCVCVHVWAYRCTWNLLDNSCHLIFKLCFVCLSLCVCVCVSVLLNSHFRFTKQSSFHQDTSHIYHCLVISLFSFTKITAHIQAVFLQVCVKENLATASSTLYVYVYLECFFVQDFLLEL